MIAYTITIHWINVVITLGCFATSYDDDLHKRVLHYLSIITGVYATDVNKINFIPFILFEQMRQLICV